MTGYPGLVACLRKRCEEIGSAHTDLPRLPFLALLAGPAPVAAAGVLVFGDSLSAGYGIANGKGWVDLLRERLQAGSI